MKKSLKLASAGVVLLGIAGVAVPYFQITGGRIKTCGFDELVHCGLSSTSTCRIQVSVATCAAGGGGIGVDVAELHMCTPNRKIIWQLNPSGPYKFADDGIAFKTSNSEFSRKLKSDYTFGWTNLHTSPATSADPAVQWPYSVHVLKGDGSDCATLDPLVYNE